MTSCSAVRITDPKRDIRELLLVNLDLIHQQQEMLIEKDLRLQSLQQENETLKCRLERIERRMSLQHQKKTATISLEDQLPHTSAAGGSHNQPIRPAKSRKSEVQDLTEPVYNQTNVSTVSSRSTASVRQADKRVHHESVVNGEHSKKTRLSCGKTLSAKCDAAMQGKEHVSRLAATGKMKRTVDVSQRSCVNADVLTTDLSYYCTASCLNDQSPDSERVTDTDDVLVPSWRINVVHTLYVIEGTENLNDSVFIKRHQKSEMEEKRRKRWDIQRTRDLLLLQRNSSSSDTQQLQLQQQTCEPFSFLPEADNVQYIEVNEHIPVSAFGFALPRILHKEFSLPWADKASEIKSTKGSQHKKYAEV